MRKSIINKGLAFIATITALLLTGCTDTGSVNPPVEPTSSTEIATSEQSINETNIGGNPIESGSNVAETSETESTEEDTTEEETTIDEKQLIDQKVDLLYEEGKEFYRFDGYHKDDIKRVYLVLNDKVFDENGKPLMSDYQAFRAYGQLSDTLFPFDIDYRIQYIKESGRGFDLVETHVVTPPSIIPYFDDTTGIDVDKIIEFENFREKLINGLKEKVYDESLIIEYANELIAEEANGDVLNGNTSNDITISLIYYNVVSRAYMITGEQIYSDYEHKYAKKAKDLENAAVIDPIKESNTSL